MSIRSTSPKVDATRARILEAAHRSIALRGLAGTSMVELAREAGVGRTTLYRHWNDLHHLVRDLLTHVMEGMLSEADLRTDDLDSLVDSIISIADQLRRSDILNSLRLHEPEVLATYLLTRLGSSQRQLLHALTLMLGQAAQHVPHLRGRNLEATAALLLLTIQGAVVSAPLVCEHLESEAWRSELRRLVRGYLHS